jgi:hypothetical protein
MTRRNHKRFSDRKQRYNNNEQTLIKKLDIRRLEYFQYDAREVFNSTEMESKVWNPLLASIVTKASRLSIKDTNEYIEKLREEGVISNSVAKDLIYLLEKYKRWR